MSDAPELPPRRTSPYLRRRVRFFPLEERWEEAQPCGRLEARKVPRPAGRAQEHRRDRFARLETREVPRPAGRGSERRGPLSLPGSPVQHQQAPGGGGAADFDKLSTIPMLVLSDISRRQGSGQAAMRSEVSAAASSAAFVAAGNIGGSILKYGSNLVIQRGFGRAGFGLYTLSMSIITLVSAVFNLGLDDAMVRYVAIYRAKREPHALRGLAIFCTTIAGGAGVLGALLVLLFAPALAAIKRSPDIIPLLQVMSPMIPLLCVQTIWISGLQGFKEFRWRVLLQRIVMPTVLILLLFGSLVLFHNLLALVIAALINTLVGALLSLGLFFRKFARTVQTAPQMYHLRDWFGFAGPNLLTAITDTVLESVDTLLLTFFAISNTALGEYAAAIKISGFILMPQASFNAMFAPTIAELHSRGEKQKLEAMFKVVTKWAVTCSLPIFGIATLFSRPLLSISGQAFIEAWPLVIAFCIGTMINVSTGSVGYILLMTGHTKISFLNSATAVVVNIAVGCALAPRYGAMGVAVATGMAVSVVNLMRLLQVRLLVKMQPYRWDVFKPLGACLISALFTGLLLYLLGLAHVALPIELGLIPVFLASYAGLLALFKIGPEDRIVIETVRRKFSRAKKKQHN